jgi:t-SNARE complex subunit (syntaxin)
MPLFPGHEPPSTKKIIVYIIVIIAVMAIVGYLFPHGSPFVP